MSTVKASILPVLVITSDTGFLSLGGKTIILRAFESIAEVFPTQNIVVICMAKDSAAASKTLEQSDISFDMIISDSLEPATLASNLTNLLQKANAVLVHDVLRPLTSRTQFDRTLAAFSEEIDAVRPAMPYTETLKILDADSVIQKTLDRSTVFRISTPELIRVSAIDFSGSDCGWFLPLKSEARTLQITGSSEGLRINSEDDRNLIELHTN